MTATHKILISIALLFSLTSSPTKAQAPQQQPPADPCDTSKFGCLEAPLPGLQGLEDIDKLVKAPKPFLYYLLIVTNFITAGIIVIGLISIVVGGYFYITAGGNASRIDKSKTFISAAIIGILLALTAFLILTTISPQFTENLEDPIDLLK